MADNVHKYGIRWSISANGGKTPQPIRFTIADAYQAKADNTTTSVDLNIGDPVKLLVDGTVALMNTTDLGWGVIIGFEPYWNGSVMQPTNRLPGGTTGGGILARKSAALVVPLSAGYWEIDCDDKVTATTEAAYQLLIGGNYNHTCVGDTTNASQPKADPMLDISALNTTALTFRLAYISTTAANQDFSGSYVKVIVRANAVQEAPFYTTGLTT